MKLHVFEEQADPCGKIRPNVGSLSASDERSKSCSYSSLLPQDVDFLSTRFTRLVSVRSFSSVFSTRLARSSIILFSSSSSFPISCPIYFWRLMIEERASRPASCSWIIFYCCCRISSKPKPLVSSGSSKSQGLGAPRLAPPVIRLDLRKYFFQIAEKATLGTNEIP